MSAFDTALYRRVLSRIWILDVLTTRPKKSIRKTSLKKIVTQREYIILVSKLQANISYY